MFVCLGNQKFFLLEEAVVPYLCKSTEPRKQNLKVETAYEF